MSVRLSGSLITRDLEKYIEVFTEGVKCWWIDSIGQKVQKSDHETEVFTEDVKCTEGYSIGHGACFSKVPKLFGRISGDIILFVSSKRRRLEARNFAVIFISIPFTTY